MSKKGMNEKTFMLLLFVLGIIVLAVIIFIFTAKITGFGISAGEHAGSLIPEIKRIG